jgi:hypothetical protein
MYYEELILCGDEGRLKASEYEDFLAATRVENRLEIICADDRPSRITTPTYPAYIEESGHNGSTYYEHVNFIDNIEGKETNTATAEDGFWSVVVAVAAEEAIKSGRVVDIDELLHRNGLSSLAG